MTRRPPPDDFDPFDEDSFDDDLETVDLEALRLEVDNLNRGDDDQDDDFFEEAPQERRGRGFGRRGARAAAADEDEPAPSPKRRAAAAPAGGGRSLGVGQVIVGIIQVIVYAVVALALFLLIGFGVVFAGQQLGVIPAGTLAHTPLSIAVVSSNTGDSGAPSAIAVVPTNASAVEQAVEQPTVPPTQPPPPTATVDPGCPSATMWWNNQTVQENYVYFTTKALNDARGSSRLPALLEQMGIRRDYVANLRIDPAGDSACLDPLRADLLRGFDATLNAVRVVNTDEASALAQQSNADQAYADLFDALRALGVTVSAPTESAS